MASRSSHCSSRAAAIAGSAASASCLVSNNGAATHTATMSSAPLPFKYSRTLKLNSRSALYFIPSYVGPDSTVEETESSLTLRSPETRESCTQAILGLHKEAVFVPP